MLALEVALGVLPITVVGGFYAAMGTMFGTVSILVSVQQHALGASWWWLGMLALALGGLVGIMGLWLLVAVSETGGTRTARISALTASAVGVVTALAALALAAREENSLPWFTIYLLVSPVVVACRHSYLALSRGGTRTRGASDGRR